MAHNSNPVAVIVGAGAGLSASISRRLASAGYGLALASRNPAKLDGLVAETGALAIACDATEPDDVDRLFTETASRLGPPEVVVFTAATRIMGPIVELDPVAVEQVLRGNAMAAFLTGQAAARAMRPRGVGSLVFIGASASFKGYPNSAPYAMAKFAVRGLAQSLARELGPAGIHVGHVMIDGGIRSASRPEAADRPDSMLDPDAIAAAVLQSIEQPRSAWTHELDLRPWVERF